MDVKKALQALLFPVKKVEAFLSTGKKLKFNNAISHFIVAETENGPLVVNSCSRGYQLVPNEKLLVPIVEAISDEHDVQIRARRNDLYSKFAIDLIFRKKGLGIAKKDDIFPQIKILNSYDGSLKLQVNYGFHRLACSNGLSVPVGEQTKGLKIMHTSGTTDQTIESLLKGVKDFIGISKDLAKLYDPLLKVKLSEAGAAKVIEEIAEETKFSKKSAEAAMERLQKEAKTGLPITNWLVYNAVNHSLYNNPDNKMPEHKRDKVDKEILQFLLDKS